ncbi:MSCRAMM family protein [Schaalia vaccimaxillae]|uniref:MSCRAMM family protein n=1 Tax=Schaalia vaccimaxillae TaxID=183916 RepID=UPI0003B354F0|nr:SpaA isopeptide-forming pilin-related protein [Schaalia vaccimaxillae]
MSNYSGSNLTAAAHASRFPRTFAYRRLLTVVIAAALTFFVLLPQALLPTAAEDINVGGVQITVGPADGVEAEIRDGKKVFKAGQKLVADIKTERTQIPFGQTINVEFSGPVSLVDGQIDVKDASVFLESATVKDGVLSVTFKTKQEIDRVPAQIGQVDFGVDMAVNESTQPGSDTIEWKVNGKSDSVAILVEDPQPQPQPQPDPNPTPGPDPRPTQDTTSKWGGGFWGSEVRIENERVILDDSWIGKKTDYGVTLRTVEAFSGNVTDTLTAPLTHVPGSFQATLTTWDDEGRQTDTVLSLDGVVVSGQTATIPVTMPAKSQLVIRYQAQIPDKAARDALQKSLQDQYDQVKGSGGNIKVNVKNTVDVPGHPSATTESWIGYKEIPPATYDEGAFSKTANPYETRIKTPPAQADGTLTPAVDVTYTLTADIKKLVARATPSYPLPITQNVVIEDTLDEHVEWFSQDPEFLTASGITLARVNVASCTAATMRSDAYVGQYCVDGRTFIANVGKETTTQAVLNLKARITNLKGLTPWVDTNTNTSHWSVPNIAYYYYQDKIVPRGASTSIVHTPDFEGTDQSWSFKKSVSDVVQPSSINKTAGSVTYNFFVASDKGYAGMSIIDKLDTTVFDLSNTSVITSSVTGKNAYWADDPVRLTAASGTLDVTVDNAGVLRIGMTSKTDSQWPNGTPGALNISVTVPTKVFNQGMVQVVENHANLYGADQQPKHFSDASQTIDSFGSVVDESKTVRDRKNGKWVSSTRIELNEDSTPKDPYAVYRIEVSAHKGWNATIVPIHDHLPEQVEFVGFVAEANVDDEAPQSTQSGDMGDYLTAVYSKETRTVTISSKDGKKLTAQAGTIGVNILVKYAAKLVEGVPIINSVGGTTTTITPSNDYPLTVRKTDAENVNKIINDPNARFVVKDGRGQDAAIVAGETTPIFVQDGYLRTTKVVNGVESIVNVTVKKPGTYYVYEVTPPQGYELAKEPIEVTVDDDGASNEAVLPNTPKPVTGTIIWSKIDANSKRSLSGSQWKLTGPGLPGEGVVISDCVSGNCQGIGPRDENPTAGAFRVTGLDISDEVYTLVETQAPAGYIRSDKQYQIRLTADKPEYVFDQGIENHMIHVPTLPLTGGVGADGFIWAGTLTGGVAVGLALVRRRKN